MDQAIPYLVNKFVKENKLPNIAKLIDNGVYGQGLSCPPCDTPTNWTTIATGATTGVHGSTSFYMHIPGEPFELSLKHRSRTQLSRLCNAEYIWDTVSNHNLTPFVINYPSGWPSKFKQGAMSLFTWPIPESLPQQILSGKRLTYKISSENNSEGIKPINGQEFSHQTYQEPLQIELDFSGELITNSKKVEIFLLDSQDKGYDCIIIRVKGETNDINLEELNKWSKWISINLKTPYGELPCLFKIKLVNIDNKGKKITLERSPVYNSKGWSSPDDFGEKLIRNNLLPNETEQDHEVEYMISGEVAPYLEIARNEAISLGNSIIFAKKELNWDVCFFHIHHLDTVNHRSLAPIFKRSPFYSEENAREAYEHIEIAYKIVDELVGKLMRTCVDEDTVVLFIADHGAIPAWRIANIPLALEEAGLLSYKWNQQRKKYTIDWNKTQAYAYLEPPYIWVNLKGRDPQGIVKKTEYESVRDRIIIALLGLEDPDTGQKIVKKALRKEDAEALGQKGERIGDVVYFLEPPYQIFDGRLEHLNAATRKKRLYKKPAAYDARGCFGAHAYYLPDETFGDFSISVPWIFSGPGIKKGYKHRDHVELIDIAPTLSKILNIPPPKNAEGKMIQDIFEL
ncbi:MAG: hypothetical protein GF317_08980 [Candidatus Lokiarchaeota archaeon]|nr:hypothetical protein [Candidatus Lokiarchaeota archaeon]MBD3199845.1 hypothetical protein [Candidatus Lokiarchaeota archaeon]